MSGAFAPLGGLARKLRGQWALLRRDPQAFAGNVMQVTHPALFRERLTDIQFARPMQVRVAGAAGPPRLNVLSPGLTRDGMTGGPNTLLNLAARIAREGVAVRLVTTVWAADIDRVWLQAHLTELLGGAVPPIAVESAADAAAPLTLRPNDVFMASHWSTAQQLKPVLPQLAVNQFLYMLQDFEPGFYAWSSNYALALETYGMDFWPVCNEGLLAEHLFASGHGRFAEAGFRDRASVFEPAIEARVFHPPSALAAPRPRRLLFYARPTNHRNLFGLGLEALRRASADPALAGWELLAIGGRGGVPTLPLDGGHTLRPAPWQGYLGYAQLLRDSDVMLAPMLSPHTGYPALEMAACGGLAVTNTFSCKTEAALAALSDNLIAGPATLEDLSHGVLAAARRVNAGRDRTASIRLPRDWAESLDPVAARLAGIVRQLAGGRSDSVAQQAVG